MSKKRAAPRITTRKHLARAQREQRQRRIILIGTTVVLTIVVIVLGYGFYDSTFVDPYREIAVVNGEPITKREFQGRVRLMQRQLLVQLNSYAQMESYFASDPDALQQLQELERQLSTQLANAEVLGRQTLEQLIMDRLIAAEAKRRGLQVTAEEIDRRIEQDFGFYSEGTPTPMPTRTLVASPTLDATMPSTATSEATPRPTSTPRPTPTPYTREAFESEYQAFVESLSDFKISEQDFRTFVETQLYREKLEAAYEPELPDKVEQVEVWHILFSAEEAANAALARLEAGEAWEDVASELSEDETTREESGLLGWRTVDELASFFGQAGVVAYSAPIGELVGPLQTESGWHIFRVTAREERPLSAAAAETAARNDYQRFLVQLRNEAEVTISEDWASHLPPPIVPGG